MSASRARALLGLLLVLAVVRDVGASDRQADHGVAAGRAAPESTAPGAKSLALPGLDGTMHTLAEWKGRVVVLNFWASWCSPCLKEIRDFVSLQDEHGATGLQIIGVGLDEARKLGNVGRTLDINYPILVTDEAAGARMMEQWGNRSGVIPYTVVMDRAGRVVYRHRGPMRRAEFEEQVLPLLSGTVRKAGGGPPD
ncbi:MAG: TlpA disulfide reductase family protein [Rhodocyclaceae bacterium]|nr:TlpA disulfide reductase family protein [Rhodocyclaceae bacterium]